MGRDDEQLQNNSSNKECGLELEPDISLLNDQLLDEYINLALNKNDNENQDFTAPPLDDDTFIKNVIEYAATCDESIIEDVFNQPPHLEETLAPFMSLAEPRSGSTDDHSKEPSVEVATPEEASKVVSGDEEELMEIETAGTLDDYAEPLSQHQTSPRKPNVLSSIDTTWTLDVDVDDYLVPPPMSKTGVNFTSTTAVSPSIRTTWTLDVDDHIVPQHSSQADFNFPAAYTPFTLPIGNTDGDIVVEVAPIPAPSSPARSWTVIKQGPVLSARQPGTPAQCSGVANKRGTGVAQTNCMRHIPSLGLVTRQPAQGQEQKVSRKGGSRVPQSNAERCTTYRMRQKAKKEREDEELRTLSEQNRMLKAKEVALRKNVLKIKAALLKIGLGGYF